MSRKASSLSRTTSQRLALQQGFNLLELVVVFVVVGVLAAIAMRYYAELIDGAKKAGIEASGRQFAAVASGLHAQWYVNQVSGNSVSPLLLEQQLVYMNEFGWPANTDAGQAAGAEDQTAAECVQLWEAFSRLILVASIEGESERGSQRYHVSAPEQGYCRYELATKKEETYYFDYDLRTGRIEIFAPTLNSQN